ncbi:MAG: HAD hydrolase family protein, partial [Oscillospiraceae bacterium]
MAHVISKFIQTMTTTNRQPMIKLIATDLDGTLLDDAKNSPPNFWETVDTLSNKGINFAIASGRTLRT